MSHLDLIRASSLLRSSVTLLAAATLAACATTSRPAVQTSSSQPDVSYVYGDDQGLLDATQKAETYCSQYNAWPTASSFDSRSDGQHVTFSCDQPRNSSPASNTVVMSTAPAAYNYPYRDDQGLINAVSRAQQYCSGFNSNARSTRVTTAADGTRTFSFECERM